MNDVSSVKEQQTNFRATNSFRLDYQLETLLSIVKIFTKLTKFWGQQQIT